MKKLQYTSTLDIDKALGIIFANNPHNHEAAFDIMVLYILHKAGLIEDGINQMQFDAAYDAFIDSNNALASLIELGVAHEL